MAYRFEIPGPAVGQQRPGSVWKNGRRWRYDPPKSRDYKAKVRAYALKAGKLQPIKGAVSLTIWEYRAIPKSWSKKKHAAALEGQIAPTSRPDWDNIAKGVQDALKGLFWKDDAQVVDAHVHKEYSDTPRVIVEVQEWRKHENGR